MSWPRLWPLAKWNWEPLRYNWEVGSPQGIRYAVLAMTVQVHATCREKQALHVDEVPARTRFTDKHYTFSDVSVAKSTVRQRFWCDRPIYVDYIFTLITKIKTEFFLTLAVFALSGCTRYSIHVTAEGQEADRKKKRKMKNRRKKKWRRKRGRSLTAFNKLHNGKESMNR